MIYTIGHTESYLNALEVHGKIIKAGRENTYPGGSVWKTREEAQEYLDSRYLYDTKGFSIFGVFADWDKDTVPSVYGGHWHDLLIDAECVVLEEKDE